MDVSELDSPSTFKDLVLTSLLMLAISGLAYAYRQYQNSQSYLKKIISDIEGLSKAEETLQDLQEKLQRRNSKLEHSNNAANGEQQCDNNEVSVSTLEVSRLREEVDSLRNKLLEAEIRCHFHQHVTYEYFLRMSFWQLFLVTFWLWQKNCTKNARI